MNLINLKYHLRRISAMLRFKGIRYTANYLFYLGFYHIDFVRNLFLIKLYPLFVFYPRYIEIEVTTRCNLKCTMCEHTYWDEKNQDMSFENFKSIVDQFPKLKWIGLSGIGESFLHKDFIKMLWYIKSKSIYCEIYDPFFFIDEKRARELIEMRFDRLVMSIDAATKETYEKIRVGSDFDRVIENLKRLLQIKKELKAHYPEVMFHYIISKDNIGEVIPFIDLVDTLRGEEDVAITFSAILHPFKEIKDMVVDIPEDMIKDAERKASMTKGIKLGWNKNVLEKPPILMCTEWTMPFFHVDGTVVPCCASNENNLRTHQHEFSPGNIFSEDFRTIWKGRYKELRDMIHKGDVPTFCIYCPIYDTRHKVRKK